MRAIIAVHNCFTDPTNGAMRCTRIAARWLAEAGHEVRALATGRFETAVAFTIEEHLAGLGVSAKPQAAPATERMRPVLRYSVDGVPVTTIMTRDHGQDPHDATEATQFRDELTRIFDGLQPDLLLTFGSHSFIFDAMRSARQRGVTTVFALHAHGYDQRDMFRHVDYAFTAGPYLARHYKQAIGLAATVLDPAMDWRDVEAPAENRRYVTLVNALPHKGLHLFMRLAAMHAARRPDIPMLLVESTAKAALRHEASGIDLTQLPQVRVVPAMSRPADIFALTRILLAPSVFNEPVGCVAAEAMMNGIPALVSDRGGLADTIGGSFPEGGGFVLPVPAWMNAQTDRPPSEAEVQPWFDAVCRLWDDAALYGRVAARGREIARQRYSREVLRQKHLDYLQICAERGDPGRRWPRTPTAPLPPRPRR